MATLAPVKNLHRTKEEYVYDTLRTAIMHCDLQPGAKLVIDTLSEELGVSPIPIREALQRLQAEGLVEITPHTGAVVSKISPNTANEVFVLLEALEVVAFRTAVTKATAEDIAYLQQLVDQMEQYTQNDDANQWSELNNQFHLAVANISGMKMLPRFTSRVLDSWDRLRRYYFKSFNTIRINEAQADHHEMIELMRNRDAEGLSKVVSRHNYQALEVYQELMKENKG
jgi:DNA-binding GntR family transcriptional regulator